MFLNVQEWIGAIWADVLPQFEPPAGMEHVWVEPLEPPDDAEEVRLASRFMFDQALELSLPGLDALSLVLAPGGGAIIASLDLQIVPTVVARVEVPLALHLNSELLQPVRRIPSSEPGQPDRFERDPDVHYVEIGLGDASLTIDAEANVALALQESIDLPPCMIGASGFVIEASDIQFYLRGDTPPAGQPAGWRGIHMANAALYLPSTLTGAPSLQVTNAFIGNGGFSGAVTATWTPPLAVQIAGMACVLESLSLSFVQNVPVQSRISATLNLPFFDQPIGIDLGLAINGDFTVTLSAAQPPGVTRTDEGLIEFEKPGLLRLRMDSLGFEKSGGDFRLKLSGAIKLLYGGLDWPEVDVRELSIDQHGHIHIDGGWLDLPQSKVLDFNGFTMELSKIGFGNDGDRRWIGFSGGIRLVDELAFGASVEGLKVLWDSGGNVDLQMSSIRVELTIPDVLQFDGFVNYFHDADTKGFKGDIELTLDPIDTTFDASLIVGKNTQTPSYNFFYIFIDAELPAGIPLAQTNLSIYGFSALMGNNVAPTRTADQEWFQWYLLPPIGTTATQKWTDERGTQALGAGLTVGTASDNGFAFSVKALLILLLPGPLLLIDGKANMLKERKDLGGNAQGDFRALAVLDRRAGTFLINIQPRYKWDLANASVIDVIGVAEGFFDFNRPDAWHLYLGQDEPREKRIRAKILKGLLRADSYLMLDQPGMRLGASAGFDEEYKFGPLSVALKAQIDGQAEVSWRPIQVDGLLTLEGQAKLRAFGCKASASVNARLEVQTPEPYYIYGSFRVRLRTPWPLRDPSARVRLEWGNKDADPNPIDAVASVAAEHLKVTESWNLALTTSPTVPPADVPVIPLDSKVLISFARPVADRALVGCNAGTPPHAEKIGQLEMLHELFDMELSRPDHSVEIAIERRTDGEGSLWGMWLPLPAGEKAAGKLQLWSGSPFTYGRNSGRSYLDWFLDKHSSYPCTPAEPAEEVCFDFDNVGVRLFPALFVVGDLIFEFLFTSKDLQPRLVARDSTWTGTKFALLLGDPDAIEGRIPLRITFPEPASAVRIFLHADRPTVVRGFRDGQEVASKETIEAGDVELVIAADGMEFVELALAGTEPRGKMWVLQVCFTPQFDHDRAQDVDRVRVNLQKETAAETARWCGEGHLLEPDALYRLKITTRLRKWHDGEEDTPSTKTDRYVYFRTAGPPGFFPTESALRDLTPYVDAERSTPHNGAEPVYRGYDLRFVFNENYVETMYDGNGFALGVNLRDRNGQPARDESGQPVSIATAWPRDPYATPVDSDRLWRWALEREAMTDDGCQPAGDAGTCVEPNSILETRLGARPLAPRILIEANVIASGREEPLHHLTFTTSRFVTFIHHIHSFANRVWDHLAPLLTPDELARLAQIVNGFNAELEAALFDEATRRLFKLAHRPLPERLEITLLRDASRSYALLLESPEPIAWTRTSLTVRRRAEAGPPMMPVTSAVKIIDVALPSEWIDVLIATDTNISGYAIEYAGSDDTDPSFNTYYRFAEEPVFAAGTIIRIHAGAQDADPNPAPERLHRYASVQMNAAMDTIRVVDANGRATQRWSPKPNAEFEEMSVVMIRNADQTSALILFPGTEVPEGRLRFEWRFLRDLGPDAPVLTVGGQTDPEATAIEFTLPPTLP